VTPGTLVLIALAMSVAAFVKGATGQGLPPIVIPVVATFMGLEAAVVIMTIPGVLTNTWLLWNYREHFKNTRDLPVLLVMGTLGAVLGTFLLRALDEDVLSLVLAGLIGLYVVVYLARPSFRLSPALTRFTSPPVGLAAGVLQGATGLSGPLISTYLHGYRLEKEAYVLSLTTVFQVWAFVQGIALVSVGLFTRDLLVLSLLSLIPIMGVLPLGARFATRLSRRTFDLIVLTVLVCTATKLVFDALF
jgi:uncharacterized membrane protein YfcA